MSISSVTLLPCVNLNAFERRFLRILLEALGVGLEGARQLGRPLDIQLEGAPTRPRG